MVIGRSEDRDNPGNPLVLRHHVHVWDPIRVTHLGPRSADRTPKAAHMTAFDQTIPLPHPCETGAVHIWVPGPALMGRPGMTTLPLKRLDFSPPFSWQGEAPLVNGGCMYNRQETPHPNPLPASGARENRAAVIQPLHDFFTSFGRSRLSCRAMGESPQQREDGKWISAF
jgi:hypothetical protein